MSFISPLFFFALVRKLIQQPISAERQGIRNVNRCDTMAGISEAQRMQLTVQQVRGETWKDLVEIPYQWRTDSKRAITFIAAQFAR